VSQGRRQWPKPLQQPHPPILVGGNGRRSLELAARPGHEWFPHARGEIVSGLNWLRQERGADAHEVNVSVFAALADVETVAEYRRLGVGRCVFELPAGPEAKTLARLEQLSTYVHRVC